MGERIYLADDISKRANEDEEEHYNRLKATEIAVAIEINRSRCVTCDNRQSMADGQGMVCIKYDNEIDREFLYVPHDCKGYSADIPF